MPTLKKTTAIFQLMELFLTQKEISSYDKHILDEFACDKKTLERYLKEIESQYEHIIKIKKGKQNFWKLVSVSDVFEEFVNNSDDISQLFLMAEEFDPYIFKELEKGTLSKIAKSDENVFLFKNSIMEDIHTQKAKEILKKIKSAIARHEYRDIVYNYNEERYERDVKCIKLVFMDNNWYLALVNEKSELKFRRLSFIEEVKYSSKNSFRKSEIEPHLSFLTSVQNSMTLYGKEPQIATIKANANIAKYFQKGMKNFLPSQKFLKQCDDGGVLFSIEYTQELEVLPFVQRWLPDLIVVEPISLKKAYIEKLRASLENQWGE